MAFSRDESAGLARATLLAAGFSEDEVTRYNKDDVIAECQKSKKQASNPVQIGQDVTKIEEYLALAKEGCGFLVVHAPEDERSKRAIAIGQPYGLKFAEKYNRLTLEELA
jgi:hypothetical protein